MSLTSKQAKEIVKDIMNDDDCIIKVKDLEEEWKVVTVKYTGKHTMVNLVMGMPIYYINKETGEIRESNTSDDFYI